ncbi:MAG: curli-like amyloid fiber formation chaperone CsgH [Salinivenus sp.]
MSAADHETNRGVPAESPQPPRADGEETSETGVRLVVEQKLALVRVRAVFVNDEGWRGLLSYRFTAEREGTSGAAALRRSGTFSLPPGEETVLASLPMSAGPGDQLLLRVVVYADAVPVSEDRVRHHVPP